MRRTTAIIGGLALVALVAGALCWRAYPSRTRTVLTLYGNVDLRQVDLPFYGEQRIAAVLVQEGERVHRGDVLARLDTSRLMPEVMQAEANVAAQRAVVERMHNGNRPEEIAEAQANLADADADAVKSRRVYQRMQVLLAKNIVSKQDFDSAQAASQEADAKVDQDRKALQLEQKGPRKEDIDQAEAQLQANQAQLALLKQQLADAQLVAPLDGVVRSRLMEPGEMASPDKPVFSIAITDPKWIRTYVSETELGRIFPGMSASIAVDSFPNTRFAGWIGFISPVAEFTPKTVETPELRTSLVYEVRVFVKDPGDGLRLGMPATVYVPLDQERPSQPPPVTMPLDEMQR
jgi:HlyD family secretion protein